MKTSGMLKKIYQAILLSEMKFLDLMTSVSKKDRFRLMLFLKVVFKMYAETL